MRTLLFSLVLTLPGLFAEAPKPAAKPAVAPAASSDTQIEAMIRSKFAASKISRNNFHVSVKGGVATLTGTTDVIQHKGTATRIARNSGARSVDNQIKISDAARQKATQSLARARKATVKQN
jgi:osmotically-inducible protein OsmY